MRSISVILMVVVGLVLFGCAKKDAGTEQAAGQPESGEVGEMMPGKDVTSTPGTDVITSYDVPETPVEGLSLSPFFDEAGTQSEIAVAPGGQFKLFIMAQTVEPYPTTSAQLRLAMPPGVSVLYTIETEKKLSSFGQYDFNYMVAYECTPPGRFVVVSYVCQVDNDFQGGEIQVLPGFLSDNASFLGFATCEFTEVRASGGTVTIRPKT